MKRKLISIVLIICMISLTLAPMTMIVSAEGDSGENEEMNALEALGIDTSQAPEGYDPDSRDNPYGKDTVTINPVGEFYTIGLDRITTHSDIMPSIRDDHGTSVTEYVYQSVYNELKSTIYGHEKWEADTAEEIFDGGLETGIESGVSEVTGTYLASEILTSEYPRLQSIAVDTTLEGGNKLALTAVAAGNFDGNTEGKKAQVAMVYTGALHKNGGLYLKVGDIGEDYGTSKTLLSASADIGNPNAKLNGERIETFDSAPYLMQNYLRVSTGDYDGDGRDEIAVYIPELGGSRIQVYKLRTTSGDNDYKAGSQWEVAWTYSLKETTYVSNMVSLVSGDFNSDGVDDIAATWGYYYGPEDNKGSTAVVLFGSNDGDMLQDSQEFSLTYGQSEIVRGAFAFGDLTGAGQDTLILGGQLNSDIEDGNLNSRFVALYSWDGTKFIQGKATNFDLFDKDDDGAFVHPAMNRDNEIFYSSPLCITNLDVIGQGLGENAKLYIDSLILGYGESGLTIEAALDITSQMQSDTERPVSYVEYGAAATDLVGLGKESIATMQQTFSQVDIETLSEIITEPRTYVYYDYEYYYENWFYRLFGIKSWRLVQKTYTVTDVTELTDNLRTYVPGTTYMLMMDISESYSSRTAVDASASLCVANTDADTTFLNYNRKYFTYSDPEILAVLASPPYFRDLMERDDLSGSYGESSTSYSKTEGGSSGVTATATISLGAYIGFEQE
ncbi:MAG TPA: VCBS repeat-containing protein, partial [Candidatus Diapherotrites archaeon]|nr:VCBS repeat-containing protein [Candidatus Diapherotrites archaeon]